MYCAGIIFVFCKRSAAVGELKCEHEPLSMRRVEQEKSGSAHFNMVQEELSITCEDM